MRVSFMSFGVVFAVLANRVNAATVANALIDDNVARATLLRREASANASGQDPSLGDEHAQTHKLHDKIERQARWAEKLERHEAKENGSVPTSAHEHRTRLDCANDIAGYYNQLKGGAVTPDDACNGKKQHAGANKKCCGACEDQGYGVCFTKASQSRWDAVQGKTAIDREIANLANFKTQFPDVKVVKTSAKVSFPAGGRKTHEGYVIEWVKGEDVHPVAAPTWGTVFKDAMKGKSNEAKTRLKNTLTTVMNKAKSKKWHIVDFQGFVQDDGTFIAADLGPIRENKETWWKNLESAVNSLA